MPKEYIIEGSRIHSLEGFYDEISTIVIPSVNWGRNLDAFNDILRGGFGTPDGGFIIRWANSALSREYLGYEETEKQLRLRLEKCSPSSREAVSRELSNAISKRGTTVFDWLVDIIGIHGADGEEKEDNVTLILE